MNFRSYLPAALIIAGLTAWALLDDPREQRPAEARFESVFAAPLQQLAESLRSFVREVDASGAEQLDALREQRRAHHRAEGLEGAALQEALAGDAALRKLGDEIEGFVAIKKGAQLWANDLEILGRRLEGARDRAEEDEIWGPGWFNFKQLAPIALDGARRIEADALSAEETPPTVLKTLRSVIEAIDAMSRARYEGA